jgi:hypothetical protein
MVTVLESSSIDPATAGAVCPQYGRLRKITRPTQSCPHQNVRTKWRSERFVCVLCRPTRLARLGRPINATHSAGKEETRCAPACQRKGVSNVHCTAIPSQSSRIQGIPHQHIAFAERNEGIPRSRDDIHDACRKRRMDGGSSTALAEEEEQILKCLGAAVLMRWNTVPTKLQRDWQFWGFPAGRPESVKIDHFQRTRRCYARSAAGPRVERRPRGIAAPELPRLWGPPAAEFSSQG